MYLLLKLKTTAQNTQSSLHHFPSSLQNFHTVSLGVMGKATGL